ncbi:hypothetical protein BJY04DRAFT_229664 [Aspergillus karnatakaensis]|uniref:FAD-dependent oxidoreductase n=1 Tax=Aspergillus karnatakaensis TaxID=1810916 RepID=UPI003CCE21B4
MKTFFLLSFLAPWVFARSPLPHCRCTPHEPCWPSPSAWNDLNKSVNGSLVAVEPVASICHAEPRGAACQAVRGQWTNSTWRAIHPGAVQWENWEAWPEKDEYCYIETLHKPCGQGRVSLYSVQATSASDIQAAVRFAKEHNLRLAIKNSGHCFLGRSTAPESLQIFTNRMTDIEIVDDFIPEGGTNSEGPTVTVSAGVNLKQLYATLGETGRIVVAGSAHTVGAAGGFIQGGGHSFLGPWKGMASDHALQFTVVTANGELVIANKYRNSDLFWALRGGGGGTFGVVVNVTLRTFEEVPLVLTFLNITTPVGHPTFWDAMTAFHAHMPTLNDANGAGYYYIYPELPWNKSVSDFTTILMFPNHTDTARVDELFSPLLTKLNDTPAVTVGYTSIQLPTINTLVTNYLMVTGADHTGGIAHGGSRLFSRDLLVSGDGPQRLIQTLKDLPWSHGSHAIGHIVAGGAVAANAETVDSALNPAWREALTHIIVGSLYPNPHASLEEQKELRYNITNIHVEALRSVEGSDRMGAYLNEADPYEKDFQASFWGANYARLYDIKQKWDPEGLFIVRRGVGSEDWDEEGLCRMGGYRVRHD